MRKVKFHFICKFVSTIYMNRTISKVFSNIKKMLQILLKSNMEHYNAIKLVLEYLFILLILLTRMQFL